MHVLVSVGWRWLLWATVLAGCMPSTTSIRTVTCPLKAARDCRGVRIVLNESSVGESVLRAPRAGDINGLCEGPLQHWDVCSLELAAAARRNPIATHNVVTEWTDAWVDDGSCHGAVVSACSSHRQSLCVLRGGGWAYRCTCNGMQSGHRGVLTST